MEESTGGVILREGLNDSNGLMYVVVIVLAYYYACGV